MLYDIFLSHSSAQKAWVETLADNLIRAGKRVFLDSRELGAGDDWIAGLHEAIEKSRAAVVVDGPDAGRSPWVRREYGACLGRRDRDPSFAIIPLLVHDAPATLPFIENLQRVDFRPGVPYRAAFARLLCGLDGTAPGADPRYDGELSEPAGPATEPAAAVAAVASPTEAVLRKLDQSRLVMLLTRDGRNPGRIAGELVEAARQSYPAGNVRHVTPLCLGTGDDLAPYYRSLAVQAGLGDGIDSAGAFGVVLQRLRRDGRWLLVVSAFEHGAAAAQDTLARTLRTQTETNPGFSVVLCGSEKLHKLKYDNGDHSTLSSAVSVDWPELALSELRGLCPAHWMDSHGDVLERVLTVSGGHPAIAHELLDKVVEGFGDSLPALEDTLQQSEALCAALVPMVRPDDDRAVLRRLVGLDDLGPAQPYVFNTMLRRLYWRNLIRVEEVSGKRRLVWRSPAIRDAVRTVIDYAEHQQ
jgi:hypothetical protein